MVSRPKTPPQTRDPLEQEALDRLAEARKQKVPFDQDMREAYWFAAPHRARSVMSTTRVTTKQPDAGSELNTSFGFEVSDDFPTVIVNTFMPEAEEWCVRKPGWGIPDAVKGQVETEAKAGTKTIFEAIAASNFYSEFGKGANPDLGIGTVAMWIEPAGPAEPVRCNAIPIRELDINISPWGDVDDRFVTRWTRIRYLKTVLRDVDLDKLPAATRERLKKKDDDYVAVVWGFWRIYDDPARDEVWQHVVLVDDVLVRSAKPRGAGSCAIVVGRFNPAPEWAWGYGPLLKSLPDLRTLDELAGKKIKHLDLSLDGPVTWPDDSFANIEEGLETGMAYPVRPGSAQDVRPVYQPAAPEAAIYDQQALEQRVKRLHFLDWPEQHGDTPPTATQWLDQMTMAQRRIGTPGLPFWREFCAGTFVRFQHLLEKAGQIKPATLNGKTVMLLPYNPAQKAADQQEVAQAARFVSIVGPTFPEEFKTWVDGKKTIINFRKKMGVEGVIVMRDPNDVASAVDQIAKLQQGTAPGAPNVPSPVTTPGVPSGPEAPPPQVQLRGQP